MLPLFPLPVVLLPGARLPLHIFEPRYQIMLRDCLETDRMFGLIYRSEDIPEGSLPAGSVGCHAHIEDVQALEDGRSNIIVRGGERFALVKIVDDTAPYLMAQTTPVMDAEEPVAQVTALALRLGELFVEAAVAARALDDDASPIPALNQDPSSIAYAAAASIGMETADLQRLLASTSPSARMRQMITLLDASIGSLKERASLHAHAKTNGDGRRRET